MLLVWTFSEIEETDIKQITAEVITVMTDAMREMLLIKTRQSFSRAQNLKER
jgi:hypothetical protein